MPRPRAFTLIEALLVLVIVATLIALLAPSLEGAGREARATRCRSDIRTLVTAVQGYLNVNNCLPPAFAEVNYAAGYTAPLPLLMPFLDAEEPSVEPDGSVLSREPFACPADREFARARGFSYGYVPAQFMTSLPTQAAPVLVTRYYEHGVIKLLFVDRLPFHSRRPLTAIPWDGSNLGYFDGSVKAGAKP